MIASFVGDHHHNLDWWLELQLAINTAVHKTTGVTPAVLALGCDLKNLLKCLIHKAPAPSTTSYHTLHSQTFFVERGRKTCGGG